MDETTESAVEVEHPYSDKVARSMDEIIEMQILVKKQIEKLRVCDMMLRGQLDLWANESSDAKTRRIKTDRYTVKLTKPSDQWSQPLIRECLGLDPELFDQYFKINSYSAIVKEVNKAEAATGNERFEVFKAKMISARSKSTLPSSVSVEKGGD